MLPEEFERGVLDRLETLPVFRSAITESRKEDTAIRVTLPETAMHAVGSRYDTQVRNKIDALLSLLELLQTEAE